MLIFPSMVLYNGNVVGLYRGNYDDMKVYTTDPMEIINDFVHQSVTHIHMVDMGSSQTGKLETVIVNEIKEETSLFVQVGGGISKMYLLEKYLDAGADRIVIGNAALTNEVFIKEALAKYGDKIAISMDVKDGSVCLNGRTDRNSPRAVDFAKKMQSYGAGTLVIADITKVGSKSGVNYNMYADLAGKLKSEIIVSGGVASLEDIMQLSWMGMYGVIIGSAYYDGAVYVKQAIRLAQ